MSLLSPLVSSVSDSASRRRTEGGCRCHDGLIFRAPQVNLSAQDIEATVGCCRGLLGFTETYRTPRPGTPIHVELCLDGFTLGLATIESLRTCTA